MIEQILAHKRKEVVDLKSVKHGHRRKPVISLELRQGTNIFAELKYKSPSAGRMNEIDDTRIAVYSRYATAISVLTDNHYFGGSFDLLAEVSRKTRLPVLCKDFIIDRIQIDLAYSKGADMILLIARILNQVGLKDLYEYAREKGLQCLVEVHTQEELERIPGLNAEIIGVNARDLDTLSIDLSRAAEIMTRVQARVKVAESGIKSRADMERVPGANCFLIGETLMRSEDPESTFRELLSG